MYKEFGISDEVINLSEECEKELEPVFKEIEKNAQFCPHCGAKQTEEPKLENEEVKS